VHPRGAELDLHWKTGQAGHRDMDRTVSIGFGCCYVVVMFVLDDLKLALYAIGQSVAVTCVPSDCANADDV